MQRLFDDLYTYDDLYFYTYRFILFILPIKSNREILDNFGKIVSFLIKKIRNFQQIIVIFSISEYIKAAGRRETALEKVEQIKFGTALEFAG